MSAEEKMRKLRIELPSAPKPLGAYVEAVRVGPLVFLSGALPLEGGVAKFRGRIGAELSIDDGRAAARLAALNALALAREHLAHSTSSPGSSASRCHSQRRQNS